MMDLQVKNKIFFLSGASEGIGFAIAQVLAQEGATIYLGSRSAEKLDKALSVLPGQHYAHVLDVTDEKSITTWIEYGLTHCDKIHGLLINAGGPPAGRFEDLNDDAWLLSYKKIIQSAVSLIKQLLPALKNHGSSVLAITSTAIKEPIDDLLLSNVFRSAIAALLKSLARDFGKYNIRFNNLVPGRIATQRITDLNQYIAEKKQQSLEAITQASLAEIPLSRYGDPCEMANAAAFLLSPLASYITGETLIVDGGLTKGVW